MLFGWGGASRPPGRDPSSWSLQGLPFAEPVQTDVQVNLCWGMSPVRLKRQTPGSVPLPVSPSLLPLEKVALSGCFRDAERTVGP